jgi:hypothetical protein
MATLKNTRQFALQLASGGKVHLYSGPERPQEPPQIVVQVRLEVPATSWPPVTSSPPC